MSDRTLYIKLADPAQAARRAAARLTADRQAMLYGDLEHALAVSAPYVDREAILEGLAAYHREAMARIPSAQAYPEAEPWVAYQLDYERELRAAAGLDDREIALCMNLAPFLQFRGYRQFGLRAREGRDEHCRGAFLPTTDRGPMYIFNLDDPLPDGYAPQPALPAWRPRAEFWWDRTRISYLDAGNGLHLDDEPAELFPLPIDTMLPLYVDDAPGAADFLRRYGPFWSGGNRVYYDHAGRGVALEKCSRHFCDAFPPDPAGGWSHASGMVCRDGDAAQSRYQWAKRREYQHLYGLPEDSVDNAYWHAALDFERQLVAGLRALGACPRVDDVVALFTTPAPDGLWKTGAQIHPAQTAPSCTILGVATLLDERVDLRWQRAADDDARPTAVERCRYT